MEPRAQIKDFSYCLTPDLDLLLRVKVSSLEGRPPEHSFLEQIQDPYLRSTTGTSALSDIYVTCQLFADNKPMTLPMRTAHHSFTNHWTWNECLTIPIKYRDIPLGSQLAFTVWEAYAPRKAIPVGGATFKLFGKYNTLRKGKHKLYMWPWTEADGQDASSTPSDAVHEGDMDRIEKLMRKYERGDMTRLDWLDHLTFREIESINKNETSKTKHLFLFIDLPQFDFPLVYGEKEYRLPVPLARTVETDLQIIPDPEAARDNPVENKHRKLARSHRNGPLDRDLKPNAKIRDELNKLLRYPPSQTLTTEEKDLLWKFRFYLTRDKKALTKFLKCVVWTDPVEAKQASELLHVWVNIDVEDALELLGPTFENNNVRAYAVLQLRKADDEDLQLFLLQLVQALKFEGIVDKTTLQNSPLAEFLIDRAIKNPILGNYFYWYLMVECEEKQWRSMYAKVAYYFMETMVQVPDGVARRKTLERQAKLMEILLDLSKAARSKEARPKKVETLRNILADPKKGLLSFPPLPLPLDAQVQVIGIMPDKANIFKSALQPLRLTFSCVDGGEYTIIFKTGDDLRQDQLVVQIITLMDKLLRKENLDLKLTPYKVLATGSDHGMVQFIPSLPLAAILGEYGGTLLNYLRENNRGDAAKPASIPPIVMDTYIRSTAGYCVITYLLGVGDRHLDNLLLTVGGNLFHIDFGFILGRDPKPFPPPMKLSREMVEALGGTSSPSYQKFKAYCYVAFNILRKNANLILNLFSLMVNANVPDIAIEPDKAVLKVQERFMLDLTDEEAIQHFQTLINESMGAMFPQVMEKIHQVAQLLRS
ncbi:kinase-like domain-containing protein [Fimicolochytrium jonesii]|uniref:kinase-like domain-containing protein n=1 Tax=Fimicolochytrium jonesii TaxID=1396493 RepID=UPI0022FEE27E|nr:kinase-like domain-containing protein [Fimicolochytrium jonesii]KAI8822578.1 kinase-like domain-containing protein [Fimicolochytrium jonesii]